MSPSSRRAFLHRLAGLAGAGVATPLALQLAALSTSVARAAQDDYRALVCVFLYGGNDNHNTVAPYDAASHAAYKAIRNDIALAREGLAATELKPDNAWTDGRQMALHPALAPLMPLFDGGQMALVMNMGTLLRPLTLADYEAGIGRPPKLFSHNDQQSVWQSGLVEGATSGWGGRLADVLMARNGENASFTSISASGPAVLLAGRETVQYQVGPTGSVRVQTAFGSAAATEALLSVMQQPSEHLFEGDHAAGARRSIAADETMSAALSGVGNQLPVVEGRLAAQLNVVARLIAARQTLGLQRQVFFVSLGGFDHHDGLIDRHAALLGELASGLKAFYDATVALGVQDRVTTFTGSDFGRTLASNGDGSDHGWGTHQLVIGGAVRGRRWVGQLPDVSVNGRHDVGGGRLLPALAVDQYGATLGRWLGATTTQLADIFPNLSHFDRPDLALLQP